MEKNQESLLSAVPSRPKKRELCEKCIEKRRNDKAQSRTEQTGFCRALFVKNPKPIRSMRENAKNR